MESDEENPSKSRYLNPSCALNSFGLWCSLFMNCLIPLMQPWTVMTCFTSRSRWRLRRMQKGSFDALRNGHLLHSRYPFEFLVNLMSNYGNAVKSHDPSVSAVQPLMHLRSTGLLFPRWLLFLSQWISIFQFSVVQMSQLNVIKPLCMMTLTIRHRAASLADSSPASVPLPLRVEPKPKSGIRW